jgi:hypothetical protein
MHAYPGRSLTKPQNDPYHLLPSCIGCSCTGTSCIPREISEHYRETTGSGTLTPLLRLISGACAGIVAMSATYPLDMVRGRLTVQEGKTGQYRGILHAAQVITREVGTPAAYSIYSSGLTSYNSVSYIPA